jgi:NADH:ubiquinone oxidoreductase subunit H
LQRLSFEVALILVFIVALSSFNTFSFSYNIALEADMIVLWLVLWLVLSLMETNRAPFDLLEGERELIRGFNVEIRSLTFVFLFLREYGIIIVLRMIIRLVLAGNPTLLGILYVVVILFLRRCYPRVRYDIIIRIIWEIILPLSVVVFFIFSVVK